MTHRLAPVLLVLAACGARASSPVATTVPAAAEPAAPAPEPTHAAPMPPPAREPTGYSDVNTDNSLISNGSVTAASEQLLATASGFRREVYRLGGRVFAEQIHFRAEAGDEHDEPSLATYRIKLLPRMLPDLLDWLGEHATITEQDVSSIIAMESEGDAAIVRADVQARLAEIDGQLAGAALDAQVRAALEQERSKLVGAASANPDAMADNTRRVAVLGVRLEAPHRPDPYARAKMLGHARGSFLGLGVLGNTSSRRLGGGVGIGGRSPVSTLEVVGYAASTMDDKPGMTVTVGIGGYSKAFGGGNRRSLNPYVGARLGYAYLQDSYFAVAAELGVELLKQRGVLWSVSARPMGLVGASSQAAVEMGSSLGLAF
ncbi:MAG TPA: hypothetical protein VL172_19705 [Kofleriaceae bacterium]|jgi:hypothetical protein|nr:hypothetical protein [Kofleriaceae bacterium]